MQVLQNILKFLSARARIPQYFGFFHILWIGIAITAAVVLCILWKKEVIKNVNKLIFVISVSLLILELYRQVVLSFHYYPELSFSYNFNNFPWHFTTVPLIVGVFVGATSGGVNSNFKSYLATFGLLAGLWGMFSPYTFVSTIGLNIYSMLCYSAMIAIAVLILYSNQVKLEFRTYFKSLPVFAMLVSIAITFNEFANLISTTQNISMFSIDRHSPSSTPVYSIVHNAFLASGNGMNFVEYVICVLFYFVLVSVCALVPFALIVGTKKLLTTDFDAEYDKYDPIALGIRKSEGLDADDDSEEIFKFNSKVNTKKNTYRQTYFKNLHTNFGINNRGSCGYVALSMLLTYYDTILCDNIVPREFDNPTVSDKDPNFKQSPGAKFVFYHPAFNPEQTTYKQYVRFINRNKNRYLHEHLLKIALKKKLNDKPEDKKSTDFNFGSDVFDIKKTADYYLEHDADVKGSEYSIDVKTISEKTTYTDIRNYVISKIKQGYPVWTKIGNSKEKEDFAHTVVAYDYDEKLDKIYCHFGYQDEEKYRTKIIQKRRRQVEKIEKYREVYTRLVPEEHGYDCYISALVIDFNERKISHTHTDNYEVVISHHRFYYCPDGTYTTPNDLIVEFNKNKRKMSIVGVYKQFSAWQLWLPKHYGKIKLVKIGKGAFKNQKHIKDALITCEIPCIPKKAFQGCKSLKSISVPHSVKKIKAKALAGCKSLQLIHYDGTVEQWYRLKKDNNWDKNTGKYKVYCRNGILYKFGAEHVKII